MLHVESRAERLAVPQASIAYCRWWPSLSRHRWGCRCVEGSMGRCNDSSLFGCHGHAAHRELECCLGRGRACQLEPRAGLWRHWHRCSHVALVMMMQLHLQVLQHQLLRMVLLNRWRLKQSRERLLHLLLRAHSCRVIHGRFSPFHFKLLLLRITVDRWQHLQC